MDSIPEFQVNNNPPISELQTEVISEWLIKGGDPPAINFQII